VGVYLLKYSDRHLWYIFQIFLLFLLFRRTTWVEELTKIECWVYFVIIIAFYLSFKGIPYLSDSHGFTIQSLCWYYIPKLLSHFLQLYFLAALIKIPFVLVYHHASLTRKFRIAGWLQSSLPQLAQLLLLIFVFYFFIASWQAENLRTAIISNFEESNITSSKSKIQIYEYNIEDSENQFRIPRHGIVSMKQFMPNQGVIEIASSNSYFLYNINISDGLKHIQFIQINTGFLTEISQNLPVLMASHIMGYPFQINQWDSLFYKIRIWEWHKTSNYPEIKAFPFGLVPHKSHYQTSVALNQNVSNVNNKYYIPFLSKSENIFTAGRIFLPLFTKDSVAKGYWAFEMVIIANLSFFTSPIMRLLLFWLIIYLIINMLIIQRVVKFGNQIYEMIIQKFNLLKTGIREISSGNLHYKIGLEGEDEFVELARRFNQMGVDLQKKISELREKDRLEYELNIARNVQLSLLPRDLPKIKGYQIAATIKTATEVGGDFYDIMPIDDKRYLFTIGDVSGKGTSAAFYMAQCVSLIRFSRQFSDQPKEILIRLNRYFSDPTIDRQIFVTAIIGLLDSNTHTIQIMRAGHHHPILLPIDPKATIVDLKTTGLALGLERQGKFFEQLLQRKTVKLKNGDTLILFTDGLVEATLSHTDHQTKTEFYSEKHFRELLHQIRSKSAEEIMNHIVDDLEKFYGKNPLIDDFTLLILQRE
jgi:serine phosphatase RsbU (regulator of sigma subunit)